MVYPCLGANRRWAGAMRYWDGTPRSYQGHSQLMSRSNWESLGKYSFVALLTLLFRQIYTNIMGLTPFWSNFFFSGLIIADKVNCWRNLRISKKICDRGQHTRSKVNFKIKYEFARSEVGTSVIPLLRVINTSKYIFYIIYMIQGYLQGQRSISRSS